MVDEILEEKELRVQEAEQKLAWLEEEHQELQLLPHIREYLRLRDVRYNTLTPEQQARHFELGNSLEAVQFCRNESSRMRVRQELSRANFDLLDYKIINNISIQGHLEKWCTHDDAASSDDDSPKSVASSPKNSNESSSGREIERNSLQQRPRQQQREQQLPPALPKLKPIKGM